MAMRAIYLTDEERELARRVFDLVRRSLGSTAVGAAEKMACAWTDHCIYQLAQKFKEPSPKPRGEA